MISGYEGSDTKALWLYTRHLGISEAMLGNGGALSNNSSWRLLSHHGKYGNILLSYPHDDVHRRISG